MKLTSSGRLTANFHTRILLLGIMAIATLPAMSDMTDPPLPRTEYEVKAAFLHGLTQHVRWPKKTFATESSPFLIGVLGKDPFKEALERQLSKAITNSRPMKILRFEKLSDVKPCHVLFVARTETETVEEITRTFKDKPVLLVSDLPDFTKRGGCVQLNVVRGKVRSELNTIVASEAPLRFTPQLFKIAEKVKFPVPTQ